MKLSLTSVILILSIFSSTFIIAQDVDLELKAGTHFSFLKFAHPTPIKTEDEGMQVDFSTNFGLVLYAPILKTKFRLRTELGFTSISSLIRLKYNIDFGVGPVNERVYTRFKNDRLYIAIGPEYRVTASDVDFNFYVGLLNHANISNRTRDASTLGYTNPSPSLDSSPNIGGYVLGISAVLKLGNIGISSSISYLSFIKSEFFGESHPYFKLRQLQLTGGVVYSFGSDTEK